MSWCLYLLLPLSWLLSPVSCLLAAASLPQKLMILANIVKQLHDFTINLSLQYDNSSKVTIKWETPGRRSCAEKEAETETETDCQVQTRPGKPTSQAKPQSHVNVNENCNCRAAGSELNWAGLVAQCDNEICSRQRNGFLTLTGHCPLATGRAGQEEEQCVRASCCC